LALGVLGPAWVKARAWREPVAEDTAWRTFVRTCILAFALVVLLGLVLGAARRMTLGWYLGAELVIVIAAGVVAASALADGLALPVRGLRLAGPVTRPPAVAVGFWMALVAFVMAMGLSNSPYTAYDAVSYHLFFPARWLQAHRLSIIPTPFSDEAQAYQPGNGELWFLWLMLPFHGDLLARIGQVPFYLLGAASTYLIAVRCGASRVHAAYAPTLFLITPPLMEQAVGANVDLIAAASFVTAFWLGLEAIDSDRPRDWALWGCATGLFVGTKYLAVIYAPVLLLVAILRKPRVGMLWGVPGLLAFGAPWYVRNWIVAGSPLYPATLTIAGVTIGRGAYTHAAMLESFMHTTDLRLLAVSLVHAFGTPYFFAFAPVAVLAAGLVVSRRRWWPSASLLLAIGGVIALCWAAVGDNTDARFLLPAVALSPALVPLAFGPGRRLNAALHVWLVGGVVSVLIGIDRQIDLPLPWFMADWLPLHGVLEPRFLLPFAALAATSIVLCAALSRSRALPAMAVASTVVAAAILAAGAERWCLPGRCEFVQVTSPHIRATYLYGARWLDEHVHDVNVAYAGINLPYPLSGSHLSNTVYYVNIDNHWSWRFDQYAAAHERGEQGPGDGPPLARPSGVLMPAHDPDAIRPRFERRAGDREAWKMNLRRERIAYLFVVSLDPYEIEYSWHNAQGFPIEDEWARSDPQAFRLVYSNEDVRIYQVQLN
jgi:hypothetical protein